MPYKVLQSHCMLHCMSRH